MKVLIAVTVAIALVAAAVLYIVQARQEVQAGEPRTTPVSLISQGQLLFRDGSGQIASVPVDQPNAARKLTGLRCDRFSYAAGTALCVAVKPGVLPVMTEIIMLDDHLREQRRIEIPGTPSRAKLSPDGKIATWTSFVTGDSYAATGFSTRAGLLDLGTDQLVKTIEELPVLKDGKRYFASDVNYWGITFAKDDKRFYATMASGGSTYLVQGDYPRYRGQVLRSNVECPSLSPDGNHLVFKKKVSEGDQPWRLATLDLTTMRETELAETHSVDDQASWLDDHTVMYGLNKDVWAVPADGSGTPRLLITSASSPTIS